MSNSKVLSLLNVLRWPLVAISSLSLIILYTFFSWLSFLSFPDSFSPTENFLSQLGNFDLNPNGAIFYFLAIISCGFMCIGFYWGLYSFYKGKTHDTVLKIILICGIFNSIAIISSGVFSETVNYEIHFLSSFSIFLSFFPILLLTNGLLFSHCQYSRWIGIFGFVLAGVDFVFLLTALEGGEIFSQAALLEWLSVFGYLVWGVLIGLLVLKNSWKSL
jgi:hypothetical protein